jgi:hypothetical protein
MALDALRYHGQYSHNSRARVAQTQTQAQAQAQARDEWNGGRHPGQAWGRMRALGLGSEHMPFCRDACAGADSEPQAARATSRGRPFVSCTRYATTEDWADGALQGSHLGWACMRHSFFTWSRRRLPPGEKAWPLLAAISRTF